MSRPGQQGDYCGVRWKHTATGPNLTIDAPATHVENIGFFSEGATQGVLCVHDGGTLTKQGGTGTTFYNCGFKGKGLFVTGGGDGFSVEKCRFQCAWDGTVAALDYSGQSNPGRRLTVRNCDWLDGNATVPDTACISITAPVTEFLITGCNFPQVPTSTVYIDTAGANYGLISDCYLLLTIVYEVDKLHAFVF